MSLTYCEGCNQLEGETIHDENEELLCAECNEPVTKVREHDDYDMER